MAVSVFDVMTRITWQIKLKGDLIMNGVKQLDLDELDLVSGGNFGATADDSRFLKAVGLMNRSYSLLGVTFNWLDYTANVCKGWEGAGILCYSNSGGENEYSYHGEKISRREAFNIALEKTGASFDIAPFFSSFY